MYESKRSSHSLQETLDRHVGNGNLKEANPAFLCMLGYTADDVARGLVNWAHITPPHRLVPDVEERAQLRARSER